MSVHDIRSRCADVPGIQNLSQAIEAGRISFRWGDGFAAAVDVTASDAECEASIRNAAKLPPVTLIPDKPAPTTLAIGQPMTNPADAMKAFDAAMTKHASMMEDLAAQQVAAFEAKLSRQRNSVTNGFAAMGTRIDEQTSAFESMMARFTNGGPA